MYVFTDPRMLAHNPGLGHPERADRLRVVQAVLEGDDAIAWPSFEPATAAQIERVHAPGHVAAVEALRGRHGSFDADTHLSEGSVEAAFLAAGAAIAAVDTVVAAPDGAPRHAFSLARPPGHHAEPQVAMGFCLFNNVAVAAEHARAVHGLERIAIVDWDVHHGNGTQHHFEPRPDVLVCNLHQYPFYPGSGAADEMGKGDGVGYTVNVPFAGGCGDGDYVAAFEDVLLPIVERFEPELVLVSAGFDAHAADPLAGMAVTEEGFAEIAARLAAVATAVTRRGLVLCLEGGYELSALARSVRAVADVLLDAPSPGVGANTSASGGRTLHGVRALHHARWAV